MENRDAEQTWTKFNMFERAAERGLTIKSRPILNEKTDATHSRWRTLPEVETPPSESSGQYNQHRPGHPHTHKHGNNHENEQAKININLS